MAGVCMVELELCAELECVIFDGKDVFGRSVRGRDVLRHERGE